MTPASDEDQDRADMARLHTGQESALNDLMERHGEKLFHYLIRALQSEEDASDLAQEVFVRVFQNRAKFDPRHKFSTWLYTIASNLVKDRYRYRSRHPQVSLNAETPETGSSFEDKMADPRPAADENLQSAERAEAVRRAIAALPEELRLPLILSTYEDRTHAEIGETLGCTAKAVEMRVARARQLLRAKLSNLLASE